MFLRFLLILSQLSAAQFLCLISTPQDRVPKDMDALNAIVGSVARMAVEIIADGVAKFREGFRVEVHKQNLARLVQPWYLVVMQWSWDSNCRSPVIGYRGRPLQF